MMEWHVIKKLFETQRKFDAQTTDIGFDRTVVGFTGELMEVVKWHERYQATKEVNKYEHSGLKREAISALANALSFLLSIGYKIGAYDDEYLEVMNMRVPVISNVYDNVLTLIKHALKIYEECVYGEGIIGHEYWVLFNKFLGLVKQLGADEGEFVRAYLKKYGSEESEG